MRPRTSPSRTLARAGSVALVSALAAGCAGQLPTLPASPPVVAPTTAPSADPAVTPSPRVEVPGQLLGDRLRVAAGTDLAAPVAGFENGPVHAWYATLLLDGDVPLTQVRDDYRTQLEDAGFTDIEATAASLTGFRPDPAAGSTDPDDDTETGTDDAGIGLDADDAAPTGIRAELAFARAQGEVPGFVRIIVTRHP